MGKSMKQQEVVGFLASVPFFSEVQTDSLQRVYEEMSRESFEAQETIFEKGDVGDAMYVILEGKVKVHEKEHIYDTFGAGDCFGEYALIDNETRSASITTTEQTKLLKLERKTFLELIKEDAGFTQGLLAVLIRRHRQLDEIQERLASSMRELELASSKMSGLINGAIDAIILFDHKFRIVLTNPSANILLENDDVVQRSLLFFFDERSAEMVEALAKKALAGEVVNKYLPGPVKVIGSKETETINEGTLSSFGKGEEAFCILILRNIEDRLSAKATIELLTTQQAYLESEIKELTNDYGIIAEDPKMLKVLTLIEQVAQTDATVMITGETGTGKELVARAVHGASNRADKPLIRINCGAIPVNLIESELFGHEKGAFTGATSARKGRFMLADKGTIFLDEIGELPIDLQPKLLRIIQEGEFEPVGSSTTIKVDVRIIAATHRDLLAYSRKGKFREDLYYRLNVFPIEIPALRDRRQDITAIARTMIVRFAEKFNYSAPKLTEADKAHFEAYHWPGNVRELQNLAERAVIVSQGTKIDWASIIPSASTPDQEAAPAPEPAVLTAEAMQELERTNILRALNKTGWKVSGKTGAAALIKVPASTLSSRIKALGIQKK